MNIRDIIKRTRDIMDDNEALSQETYNHIRKICIENCGYPIIDDVLEIIPHKKPSKR